MAPRKVRNGLHTVESLHTDSTPSTIDTQNLPPLPVGPGWRVQSVRLQRRKPRGQNGPRSFVRWDAVLVRLRPGTSPRVERRSGRTPTETRSWARLCDVVQRVTGWRAERDAWQAPGDLSDGPVVVVQCGAEAYTSGHRVSTAQGARDVVRRVLRLPIAVDGTAEMRDGYGLRAPTPDWALSARSRSEWEVERGPDALDQWPDGAWWSVPVWSDGPTRVRVAHLAGQTGPRGRKGADPPTLRPFRPSLWSDPPPIRPDDTESAAQNASDDDIREE